MIGWVGQCAVITAPPEIDVSNAGELREAMLGAIGEGAGALVADLSETTFCDSAGITALAAAHRWAADVNCELRVVVGAVAVRRIVTITGLHRLIPVYGCLDEALTGLAATSQPRREAGGPTQGGIPAE